MRYLTKDGVEVEPFTGKLDSQVFIWVTHPTLGLMQVQLGTLTEVKPLMAEPPNLSVVRVTRKDAPSFVAERDDDSFEGRIQGKAWFGTVWRDTKTYAEILEVAESITLLVPDPFAEPVELPWKCHGVEVSRTVHNSAAANGVFVSTKNASYGYLTPANGRAMARALWAAADEAERAS